MTLSEVFTYYVKHIFTFSSFGALCIIYLLIAPVLYVLRVIAPVKILRFHRYLVLLAFRYALWICHKTQFFQARIHDESGGRYGQLLVGNHVNMFDVVSLLAYFPYAGTFVNYKFFINPLLTLVIYGAGYIPINSHWKRRKKAYLQAAQDLEQGYRFVIFPEGTRSPDGKMGAFQNGAFKLAISQQVDITPVFFKLNQSFLNKKKLFQPHKSMSILDIYILQPISPPESYESKHLAAKQLKQSVVSALEKRCSQDQLAADPCGKALQLIPLEVLESSGRWQGELSPHHPHLDGHFEALPVLPAASQLHTIVMLCKDLLGYNIEVTSIRRSKFSALLVPGESFEICLDVHTDEKVIKWQWGAGQTIFSKGSIYYELP